MLLGAKLWSHGHTHDSRNDHLGDSRHTVRLVCNPRGYPLGLLKSEFENVWFDAAFTVDIE